jgi:hypothetical protein
VHRGHTTAEPVGQHLLIVLAAGLTIGLRAVRNDGK